MAFAYDSSLASYELRLLQPLAVNDRVLRFETRRVPRASNPPYTAISYTWGNEDALEVIYLDNRPFRVRPNLWSCLYYMAHAARNNGAWDYLWVDAICINQTNDAERSSQVRLMDQTYRDAVCVSVWLGLVTLPEHIRSYLPTQIPTRTVESDGFNWAESIVDLSNRPYWSRVWVIQEFLLGQNVELHCSDNQINWLDFQEFLCREAGIEQFYDASGDVPKGDGTRALAALPLVMGRHMDKHPEILQPLCDLLINNHKSKCKDPRDRVFALLGLIPLDEREIICIYFPDYSITEDHVLIITLAHLTQFPALSIMQRGGVNITPDSEELFLGLGVGLKPQRRRLLRRAKRLDYLGRMSSREMLNSLALHDEIEEYGGEDTDEQQEMSETERPRLSNRMWLTVSVISAPFVIWLIAKKTKL
ncbi:heterokaryon incompatibility protein-domain-containing protein [Leptodontidium sp. MPI-SDFR-AT-0119]|nr:heterokaryon incompatibility protein-domain-containing protein [Leptodontidium sp. MPI-SDFR-AT-0119]